jgi:hypothetical protein
MHANHYAIASSGEREAKIAVLMFGGRYVYLRII